MGEKQRLHFEEVLIMSKKRRYKMEERVCVNCQHRDLPHDVEPCDKCCAVTSMTNFTGREEDFEKNIEESV